MYGLLKSFLFRFDPEKVHYFVMNNLRSVQRLPGVAALFKSNFSYPHPGLSKTVFGIEFPNPVGLAAGFDKDARYIDELATLGFGFIEIGTLTPVAQEGNPKPRLFRIPQDQALINRMGFNNGGVADAVQRLRSRKSKIVVGGNIGKNKLTPNEEAVSDYLKCYKALYDHVDYFVVNVSSPNTPGLRALQEKEPLKQLLVALQEEGKNHPIKKPLLLKIAPDLTTTQLDDIIDIVQTINLDGLVATNTTISRDLLTISAEEQEQIGAGGVSGKPVTDQSTEMIRYIHKATNGTIPIIAVGGIFTGADAREKLDAGAALVQVYTGFIYEGPAIASKICRYLTTH